MKRTEKIEKLSTLIENSNTIVAFTGAGVSTASGIKDFRSPDGLYNIKYKFPPETIVSHNFFVDNTDEFYTFYKDKFNCTDKEPNVCHNYLKKLEDKDKLIGIVTQNIDGLHTKAGNKNVYELHGSIYRNYCMKCHKFYDEKYVFDKSYNIPTCSCGGIIKPDVVLYNEELNEETTTKALEIISKADLLLIIGTSLTVYPASSFVNYFNGKYLVVINRDATRQDNYATLVLHDDINYIFEELSKKDITC